MRKSISIVLAIVTLGGTTSLVAQAQISSSILDVPVVTQEMNQWCWDAAAQMILKYYQKPFLDQCEVAKLVVPDFECCLDPQACNYALGIEDWHYVFDPVGIATHEASANLWAIPSNFEKELDAGHPFIVYCMRSDDTGHFKVATGYEYSTDEQQWNEYLNDPWPGEGAQILHFDDQECASCGGVWPWSNMMIATQDPSASSVKLYPNQYFGGSPVTTDTTPYVGDAINDLTRSTKVYGVPYVFYTDANYGGSATSLNPGTYYQIMPDGFDKDISSVMAMPYSNRSDTVVLFENENFTGASTMFWAGSGQGLPNLNNIGWGNRVSSMIVVSGIFQAYDGANYSGLPYGLTSTGGPNRNGFYPNAQSWGGQDNNVASVKFMAEDQDIFGVTDPAPIILYDGPDYTGRAVVLTTNTSHDWLNDFRNFGFDKVASSIRTFRDEIWSVYSDYNQRGAAHQLGDPCDLWTTRWFRNSSVWQGNDNEISSVSFHWGCHDNSGCASQVCTNNICQSPSCSPHCGQAAACGMNGDCSSQICAGATNGWGGTCQPPSCSPQCGQGAACGVNGDCSSQVCSNDVCQPPSCSPRCNQGAACGNNSDCVSQVCSGGACQPPSCSPNCGQGSVCGTNADCSSQFCYNNVCIIPTCSPRCNPGAFCSYNTDCSSQVCGTDHTCQPPTCAGSCGPGAPCAVQSDCASYNCSNSTSTCLPPACSPICGQNSACGADTDCGSKVCRNGKCQTPACAPNCGQAAACGANSDCSSKVCKVSGCQAPSCAPNCGQGSSCEDPSDCASNVCGTNHICGAPVATNTPPVVNAGSDQTITLPANATLAGSASDDGLPNPPGTLSVTWSVVSGPGTVTFTTATALSTTATFSTAGSYTLRLTASDNVLSTSDDIVITVNAVSNAPCDGLCTNPTTFTINGSYQANGLGKGVGCYQTKSAMKGGNCGNFVSPRTLKVNGTTETCNNQNWSSLPKAKNGGYCIQISAGDNSYAYFTAF